MSVQAAKQAALPTYRAPYRVLVVSALIVASALIFVIGFMIARMTDRFSPQVASLVAAGGIVLVTFQVAVQLRALRSAALSELAAASSARQITVRHEQLRLTGRLLDLLSRETRSRRIIRAAADFFVEEMGVSGAVHWKPNSDGEPEAPAVVRPRGGPSAGGLHLGQPQRLVFACTAARGALPLVVSGDASQSRPFDPASPPPGPFILFLPLRSSEMCEGVLELHACGPSWDTQRWEVLPTMATQVGVALERGRSYDEMRERADMDYVTGLYNHRFMQSYLQQLLAAAAARGRCVSVILLDVDNFKLFNDSFGHSVGDRVLQIVADQLKLMIDKVGTVARFGGDEFIVVLPDHYRREAEAFVQALQDWLSNVRSPAGNGNSPIRISCGVAVFPYDADKRQELLAVADARLYEAKRCGASGAPGRPDALSQGNLGVFGLLDRIVSSIDSKDHYTRAHCENTAEYAVALAQELGISPSAQRILRLAALLHDVGKIGIPDDILRKPGPLSVDEFAIIKHHVNIAGHLIVDVPNTDEVRKLALHHHERWDGGGYPSGLKGEEIPYLARILAVADAFSAVTLDRPHRHALPFIDAYQELRRVSGSQLDPHVVKAFEPVVRRLTSETPAEDMTVAVK